MQTDTAIQHIVGGTALTGNALAKKDIAAVLKGKNLVHFSCHGHFDPELPMQSGLHLRTPSSPFINDILTVSDWARWRIDSSLVTLSACETGRGEIAVSEFIGLTRSLLAAGANSVLATLWPVRNEPTLNFMLAFYKELEAASKQSSRVDTAEALRKTQQQFSSNTNLYDWAAFKLIGWPIFSFG
jgi:CHAT domain-containing protein